MSAISTFHLFSIGIGPSSSHTVGPMRAAKVFVDELNAQHCLLEVKSMVVDLYGSLALTGKGHGTDIAVLLGLEGYAPESTDPDRVQEIVSSIRAQKKLMLSHTHEIFFDESAQLLFHRDKQLPYHPNGMRFTVFDGNQKELLSRVYYSVGGGFIVDHKTAQKQDFRVGINNDIPHPFTTGQMLLNKCRERGWTIAELMMENEKAWRSEAEVRSGLLGIWKVMQTCVERGCREEGVLPGGLHVKRRAASILRSLLKKEGDGNKHASDLLEWVSLWALAVNEENAAGGRVVTAPTNGAAGVIPAVLHYYKKFTDNPSDQGIVMFMLTAAAMGILFKVGASISAAEMGCMGEVGVACAMAAAGLTAALGGTNEQIENAAEIGMEHNLGLTCDPVRGLVQIPCIERNTMGAIKAINASLLALQGDGSHCVSLDQVIATMRQTGKDMKSIYKETSLGGLAVNVPEC